MFQEYFKQRNVAIQKTLQTRQYHCFSFQTYFIQQIEWKKYLSGAHILDSKVDFSITAKNIIENKQDLDVPKLEYLYSHWDNGVILKLKDCTIDIWPCTDSILLTYKYKNVYHEKNVVIDPNKITSEQQFFDILLKNIDPNN